MYYIPSKFQCRSFNTLGVTEGGIIPPPGPEKTKISPIRHIGFHHCLLNIAFSFPLEKVSLLFVGDISFSGPVKYYVEHNYHSYNDTFSDVAPFIREADISIANLESPFVNKDMHRYKVAKVVNLDSSPEAVSALRYYC